jgi:hypothetical protein
MLGTFDSSSWIGQEIAGTSDSKTAVDAMVYPQLAGARFVTGQLHMLCWPSQHLSLAKYNSDVLNAFEGQRTWPCVQLLNHITTRGSLLEDSCGWSGARAQVAQVAPRLSGHLE